MNSEHLYEYVDLLERVLSYGYDYQYSTKAIERLISYSSFFQSLETNIKQDQIISEKNLLTSLYPELGEIYFFKIDVHNETLWAAESYLRILKETGLTFECIFLYIPLNKMYKYFDIYHEMDFSQIVNEFKRLYSSKSVLEILSDSYQISLKDINAKTGISYSTLLSLKARKRDIRKTNVSDVYKLSQVFNVRIETIAEINFN